MLSRRMAWMCGDVPPGLVAILVVVMLTLATSTARYASAWAHELPLWQRAVRLAPEKPRVLNNLGVALAAQGRLVEARTWFERAHTAGHSPRRPAWDRVEGERTSRANLKAVDALLAGLKR